MECCHLGVIFQKTLLKMKLLRVFAGKRVNQRDGTNRNVKALAMSCGSFTISLIRLCMMNRGNFMAFNPFPPRQPTAAARLPLTLISLEDWALATMTGADSEKYMQGQVTADVALMTENQHLLVAHCDAKGKMWSNLRLFRQNDGFAWIQRRSVRDAQLTALKKYAVFSKVTIAPDDNAVLLGVAGFQARAALANHFSTLPDADNPAVHVDDTTLLWLPLPAERFI